MCGSSLIRRRVPPAVLLWLASCRGRLRYDGGRGQCPHGLLAAVPGHPRRIRLGSRRHRRCFLVRVPRLGGRHPVCRSADGPARAENCRRAWRSDDGGGPDPGVCYPRTVAALSHARRTRRRRGQLSRLYRAVPLPDELVCPPTRTCAQHCLLWGRGRLDHDPALVRRADRHDGMAHCMRLARRPFAGALGTAEPAAQATPAGYRASP